MTRDELIKLTIDETNKIATSGPGTLYERADYSNPSTTYPQTTSEKYVNNLLHIYLTEEWIDPESEPLLDEIASVLGELDKDVNNKNAWQHLFKLVDELKLNA